MYIEKLKSYRKTGNFFKQSDYFSLFSVAALLYLLGMICFFLVYSSNSIAYVREQIPIFITLKDSAKEADIFKLEQKLKTCEFVTPGSVVFVSKEEAINRLTDKNLTKEDLMLFGENLLPNSIEFKINVRNKVNFESFLTDLKKTNPIDEITHNELFSTPFNSSYIMMVLIVFLFVLFFIFVANNLIKNSLKLSLNENKNIINLLKISGAGNDFITKPYLKNYTFKAIFTGFLSTLAVALSLYVLHFRLGDLNFHVDWKSYSVILTTMFLLAFFVYSYVLYFTLRTLNK